MPPNFSEFPLKVVGGLLDLIASKNESACDGDVGQDDGNTDGVGHFGLLSRAKDKTLVSVEAYMDVHWNSRVSL
jgi:hypothetical protein